MWKIIDSGVADAATNMEMDGELLATLESPILHFYEWERDSATYGHFIDPGTLLHLEKAKEKGLDLAKRPTGGGVVFHLWDMAFSVLVPSNDPLFSKNTLENYAFVNNAVRESAKVFLGQDMVLIKEDMPSINGNCQSFCMAKPTKYDVVLEGKKIAGAAQRQTKEGYLHQGTIALMMPDREYLEQILLPQIQVASAMQTFTYPLLGNTASRKDLQSAKLKLKQILISIFEEHATKRKNGN